MRTFRNSVAKVPTARRADFLEEVAGLRASGPAAGLERAASGWQSSRSPGGDPPATRRRRSLGGQAEPERCLGFGFDPGDEVGALEGLAVTEAEVCSPPHDSPVHPKPGWSLAPVLYEQGRIQHRRARAGRERERQLARGVGTVAGQHIGPLILVIAEALESAGAEYQCRQTRAGLSRNGRDAK
jgi:hypothetical protein